MTGPLKPMFQNPDNQQICRFLEKVKTIAVVGLSPDPSRPSYRVAQAMQAFGFKIIPVYPQVETILGERAYPNLSAIPGGIDLVDVFRRPAAVDAVIDECIALQLKAVWLQEGVINLLATQRAVAANMFVVMDRCIYKVYRDNCVK